MEVLITGTSSGIGQKTAILFLKKGYKVVGLDIKPATIHKCNYTHFICDVSKKEQLPELDVQIVINNAGDINEQKAIEVNLIGYINVVEKYCYDGKVHCIINVASISAHVGLDTPRYAASQGGRLAYTKHLAITLGRRFKTRVNSISPGAVLSGLEPELYKRPDLLQKVADENILKKWAQPEEIAEWIYFLAVVDKSMTGQDLLIDNGEVANYNFIEAR